MFEKIENFVNAVEFSYGVLSGPHFPVSGLNSVKIRTRNNSVFGHFSCTVLLLEALFYIL